MIRIIYLVSFLLISCSGEYSSDNSQFALTDGTSIDFSSPDKVIVINYWATWCSPCRKEIPELNELDHQLSDRVDVVGVNYDAITGDKLAKEMTALGMEFENLYSDPRQIWDLEEISILPETLIINTQGQLIHRLLGPQTKASLEELINAL